MTVFDQLKAQILGTPNEPLPAHTIVIDVRTADEFATGHVEGALNIPVDTISPASTQMLTDKNCPIVVYCGMGMRAANARAALMQMGFTTVVNGTNAPQTAQMLNKSVVH